ncbi:hypothetical protein AA313_de0203190 [Arthrobotrys entomopaga]|nr:hypothetical protein AA313_de0203190 [Arthrobotrys entomopaga]
MDSSQKPALTLIPMELLEEISKDLDEDDLLALRMTCSTLDAKLHELHLDSIYRTRRVFLVPTSVNNLLEISKSTMNTRVREIVISSGTPFEFPYINPEDLDEKSYELALNVWEEMRKEEVEQMVNIESRRLSEFDEAGPLLCLAFSNLPNIRHIWFEREVGSKSETEFHYAKLKRSEINLFFPGAGLSPGSEMIRSGEGKTLFKPAWDRYGDDPKFVCTVLHAAMLAGLRHLESIIDRPGTKGIPLKWFNLPPKRLAAYHESFPNIRVLELVINYDKEPSAGGGIMPWVTERLNQAFCQWLGAFASKLERLELEIFEQIGPANMPFLVSEGIGMPNLKSFVLRKAVINFDDIIKFLDSCKQNMEVLKFADCLFDNPNEDWFRLLQYLKRETTKLRNFAMTSFDKADVYKWIKDVPFVIPSSITVEGLWCSEATKCEIVLGLRVFSPKRNMRWRYKTSKNISAELAAHSEAESFWQSVTDYKCSGGAVNWHQDRFRYERRWMESY